MAASGALALVGPCQNCQASISIFSAADAALGLGNSLAALQERKAHTAFELGDDAGPDKRFGEHGVDRILETLHAFDDGDQDIGKAPVGRV